MAAFGCTSSLQTCGRPWAAFSINRAHLHRFGTSPDREELGISLKAVETYHEAAPQTVLNNR